MSSKNRNQNIGPDRNGRSIPDDVDALIEVLESDKRIVEAMDTDSREIHQIGLDIRELVERDLPVTESSLRERLVDELDRLAGQQEGDLAKPARFNSRGRYTSRFALAACLLLCIGLLALLIQQQSWSPLLSLVKKDLTSESNRDVAKPASIDEKKIRTLSPGETGQAPAAYRGFETKSVKPDAKDVAGADVRFEYSFGNLVATDGAANPVLVDQPAAPQEIAPLIQPPVNESLYSITPESDGVQLQFRTPLNTNGVSGAHPFGEPNESPTAVPSVDYYETRMGDQMLGLELTSRLQSGEQYDAIRENRFVGVQGQQAMSTFSVDVDTASYSNMRRFLNNGQRPPLNAIRIEELVNYFSYDYPQPQGDDPFSVSMELASCPWNEKHHLLRVGLKGKEIHREERTPSNLIFLLDVSGSMQSQDKLPLLKQGLTMMVQQLTENDSVSIITYAGNAGVVLQPTNGANKRQIEKAIEKLNANGSTNGSAGIQLAYELAQENFIKGGANRVVMATDGDLNVGVTSDDALVKLIKEKASEGVFLTVLGFGTGNLKDSKLEKLADNGNGMYAYIDSNREAHKVLIEQMSGSLETIAKDVKLQLEFNPGEVLAYRLIGYENRVLAAQDFDDDRKDAGEIGAGHTVTAIYELRLADQSANGEVLQTPLKYQSGEEKVVENEKVRDSLHEGEVLTLSLRYKRPDANESKKLQFVLKNEPVSFSGASSDFQFAAAVASFGMILRNSKHRGTSTLDWVEATAARNAGVDVGHYRIEFLDLVRRAKGLVN